MIQVGIGSKFKYNGKKWVVINIENKMYTFTTLDKKEKMFRHIYSSFPKEYRENIFFYLCMEDPSLWMKTLGREYSCDKEFEMDMKRFYLSRIDAIR